MTDWRWGNVPTLKYGYVIKNWLSRLFVSLGHEFPDSKPDAENTEESEEENEENDNL